MSYWAYSNDSDEHVQSALGEMETAKRSSDSAAYRLAADKYIQACNTLVELPDE